MAPGTNTPRGWLPEPLQRHLRYASYVLRHKWYVFLAARRLGVPWLGLVHDLSKLWPGEWWPYALSFYGPWPYRERPAWLKDAFDRAWLAHIHRNRHHPQHWVLRNDTDGVVCLEMPERYVREMVADWVGAGLAQGKPDTLGWWAANKDKSGYAMHPRTRELVGRLVHLEASLRGRGQHL